MTIPWTDTFLNIGVGSRGVYVADTGNNRVEQFNPISIDEGAPLTPLTVINVLSTEISLIQPSAVATAEDLLEEKSYIADTGNNRVVLVKLPSQDPTQAWTNMKASLNTGDIAAASLNFSVVSKEDYRKALLYNGPAVSSVNQIGTLTPVYIKSDSAKYYFTDTIDGQIITFPVEFIKENGVWKILEF